MVCQTTFGMWSKEKKEPIHIVIQENSVSLPQLVQKCCCHGCDLWGWARSATWALCPHGLLQVEVWHYQFNEDQCQIVLWLFISGRAHGRDGGECQHWMYAPCALRQRLVPNTKSSPCWEQTSSHRHVFHRLTCAFGWGTVKLLWVLAIFGYLGVNHCV